VVLNPFAVVGPSLTPGLNTSNRIFVELLNGAYPAIIRMTWGLVDVRDVADAHVRAMDAPNATGRYICAAGTLSMREIAAVLRSGGYGTYPLPTLGLDNPVGDYVARLAAYFQPRGVGQYLRTHIGRVPRFDNSKIQRDLGIRFRPIEDTILDTAADLIRWGHVRPPKTLAASATPRPPADRR
jgi:dihydroflavonol-4-reductase